jgi:hypothetical protein
MAEKLSKVRFAQQAGFIAKNAATWAAECLDLLDEYPDMRGEDVRRFTDDMRARLDRIDEMTGRAALQQEPRHDDR